MKWFTSVIEFISLFHESFKKTSVFIHSDVLLLQVNNNIIFVEKVHRFVVTEFVKLSDEFDLCKKFFKSNYEYTDFVKNKHERVFSL